MDESSALAIEDYQALAEFRFQIRRFLHFSQEKAEAAGLEAQQHQLLLCLKGLRPELKPAVGVLAEQMFLKPHTVVGLVDRLAKRKLVRRVVDPQDRRIVMVRLTPEGEALLGRLSAVHLEEIETNGPALANVLKRLSRIKVRRSVLETEAIR